MINPSLMLPKKGGNEETPSPAPPAPPKPYVPGQNYFGQSKKELILGKPVGKRRVLDLDEFASYYYCLDAEEYSLPVKAAVGVVLLADLKRLYQSEYAYHKNELCEKWANYYKSLNGTAKDIADSEINAFEKYLTQSNVDAFFMFGTYHLATMEEFTTFKNLLEHDRMIYEQNMANARRKIENDAFVQRDLELQKQEYQVNKMNKEMEKSGAKERYRDFVKENLIDYLTGVFSKSSLAQRMTPFKALKEIECRKKVIELVNKNQVTGQDALSLYNGFLKIIDASSNEKEYQKLMSRFTVFPASHPLGVYL